MSKEKRLKFNLPRLVMLTLIFVLGFLGIGLVQNISSADDTNPTRNTTVDCSFYIFIHDEEGNPVEGAVINAYSDWNKTNLISATSPSGANGWAHLTTCAAGYDEGSYIYFEPDTSTLPEGHKNFTEGNEDVLRSIVNLSLLDDWGYGEDEIMIFGTSEIRTNANAILKVKFNGGTFIDDSSLDPDGVVGYDPSRFSSIAGPGYYIAAFSLLPGEPEPEPTIETGNLEIRKEIVGTTSEEELVKEFDITVTLSDSSINGTYGDASFSNGTAQLKIKHNETLNITGLPAGITYEIDENEDSKYWPSCDENGTALNAESCRNQPAIEDGLTRTFNIYNLPKYTLRFDKKDAETKETLYGWEFEVGYRDRGDRKTWKLNEQDNEIICFITKSEDAVCINSKTGASMGSLSSIGEYGFDETKVPDSRYIPARNCSLGNSYLIRNGIKNIEDIQRYLRSGTTDYYKCAIDFNEESDHEGVMTLLDHKTSLTINKQWIYTEEYGKSMQNPETGEWEYKILQTGVSDDMKVEADFEITLEGAPDGEYEMTGAKEDKLVVSDEKARVTLATTLKDSGSIEIKGLPVGTKFNVEEVATRSENENIRWNLEHSIHDAYGCSNEIGIRDTCYGIVLDTVNFNQVDFRNRLDTGGEFLNPQTTVKVNFTKQVEGDNDNNEIGDDEYEFTILPFQAPPQFFGNPWNRLADYVLNSNWVPEQWYGLQLYDEDNNNVINTELLLKLLKSKYVKGYRCINYGKEQSSSCSVYDTVDLGDDAEENMIKLFLTEIAYMRWSGINVNGLENLENTIAKINEDTDFFFEEEGKRYVEKNRNLYEKLSELGFDSVREWANDTHTRLSQEQNRGKQLDIINEFVKCYENAGWTLDDFRYEAIIYSSYLGYSNLNQSLYAIYNDYNSSWFEDNKFDADTNKYFYGRTFKLKDGESIELKFPASLVYEHGVMILEKRGDGSYIQDSPIIVSKLHADKDEEGNYIINANYKNTYPAPEEPDISSEGESKEEAKSIPAKESVGDVNPNTGDKKITTLIIMMGSAVMLFTTVTAMRNRKMA